MALDNGIVVAISTIATAIIAGSITLLSKVIDAFQKKNEQAMIVRTTYVNKKLEVGIDFINITTLKINNHFDISMFYRHLHNRKSVNKSFYDMLKDAKRKQKEISSNNSVNSFFDMLRFYNENTDLIHEFNNQQIILATFIKSEGNEDYTQQIELAVQKSLEINEKMIKVYQRMILFVRTDLAKYDIS